MNKLPLAKTENIVVQDLHGETLVYDLSTNQAFCLNETSAKVFDACDGETSFDELKSKHNFTDDLIFLALDGLERENLLEQNQLYQSPLAGLSRREVIRKIGFASMIALPVISSVVAPTAAHAASGGAALFAACATPSDCASNFCTESPRRCCVPGTSGLRNVNVCCNGSPANCNPRCCSNTGPIDPNPGCAGFGGFSIACPDS